MIKKYLAIALLALSPLCLQAKSVKLASTEWPPYSSASLNSGGFTTAIVTAAFIASGYEVKVQFLPWARVLTTTEAGEVDGMFPSYYAPQRESYAVFSDFFASGPVVLFKKKSSDVTFDTYDDLKPYSIGVVRGYVNGEEFDARTDLKKMEANNDKANFAKLINDRLDLVVADKWVGADILQSSFPADKDQIDFLPKMLDDKKLYVAFSKAAPDHTQKLKDFNDGLRKIRDNGTYDEIMRGFSSY